MVCTRCQILLTERLNGVGLPTEKVEIGHVDFSRDLTDNELGKLDGVLEELGFARLQSKRSKVVERIKNLALDWVQGGFRNSHYTFSAHLAEQMGLEYAYLSHQFSLEVGQTVEQYVIGLRTELAKNMLHDASLSFTEIANRLGYSSLAHFSMQFKKTTGNTPSEYRQNPSPPTPLDKV